MSNTIFLLTLLLFNEYKSESNLCGQRLKRDIIQIPEEGDINRKIYDLSNAFILNNHSNSTIKAKLMLLGDSAVPHFRIENSTNLILVKTFDADLRTFTGYVDLKVECVTFSSTPREGIKLILQIPEKRKYPLIKKRSVQSKRHVFNLLIAIDDLNDHQPYCENSDDVTTLSEFDTQNNMIGNKRRSSIFDRSIGPLLISLNISEDHPSNSIIYSNIRCFDNDKLNNINSQLLYYIKVKPNDYHEYFDLNSVQNPTLILRKPLDYSIFQKTIITIHVEDQGLPSLSTSVIININIHESKLKKTYNFSKSNYLIDVRCHDNEVELKSNIQLISKRDINWSTEPIKLQFVPSSFNKQFRSTILPDGKIILNSGKCFKKQEIILKTCSSPNYCSTTNLQLHPLTPEITDKCPEFKWNPNFKVELSNKSETYFYYKLLESKRMTFSDPILQVSSNNVLINGKSKLISKKENLITSIYLDMNTTFKNISEIISINNGDCFIEIEMEIEQNLKVLNLDRTETEKYYFSKFTNNECSPNNSSLFLPFLQFEKSINLFNFYGNTIIGKINTNEKLNVKYEIDERRIIYLKNNHCSLENITTNHLCSPYLKINKQNGYLIIETEKFLKFMMRNRKEVHCENILINILYNKRIHNVIVGIDLFFYNKQIRPKIRSPSTPLPIIGEDEKDSFYFIVICIGAAFSGILISIIITSTIIYIRNRRKRLQEKWKSNEKNLNQKRMSRRSSMERRSKALVSKSTSTTSYNEIAYSHERHSDQLTCRSDISPSSDFKENDTNKSDECRTTDIFIVNSYIPLNGNIHHSPVNHEKYSNDNHLISTRSQSTISNDIGKTRNEKINGNHCHYRSDMNHNLSLALEPNTFVQKHVNRTLRPKTIQTKMEHNSSSSDINSIISKYNNNNHNNNNHFYHNQHDEIDNKNESNRSSSSSSTHSDEVSPISTTYEISTSPKQSTNYIISTLTTNTMNDFENNDNIDKFNFSLPPLAQSESENDSLSNEHEYRNENFKNNNNSNIQLLLKEYDTLFRLKTNLNKRMTNASSEYYSMVNENLRQVPIGKSSSAFLTESLARLDEVSAPDCLRTATPSMLQTDFDGNTLLSPPFTTSCSQDSR
ncbi:hypothetical protein SNEBB_006771 [Seison nebaliae]|nr:hypothetical protein SNEBB_006771 [Seison nebaliae]